MSLRDHYLEKARAYKVGTDRQDGRPIDADPVRATLLLAIMDADYLHAEGVSQKNTHEHMAQRADERAAEAMVEREQLLDALVSLKPLFPGNGADPYADKTLRPSLNKDAARV